MTMPHFALGIKLSRKAIQQNAPQELPIPAGRKTGLQRSGFESANPA